MLHVKLSPDAATAHCESVFLEFHEYSEQRRRALISIMANVGYQNFKLLHDMIAAIYAGDWLAASKAFERERVRARWARGLSTLMRKG